MKQAWLLGLVLVCGVATARADSLHDVFVRGNAAYARGDYAAAVQEYTMLVEAGVQDAAVSYNLGCAYGALGQYGSAIRYFERSLRQAPGDDAVEQRLKLARDLLGERQAKERGEALVAERPPLSAAVFASVSENTLAAVLLIASALFSVALCMLAFARGEANRLGLGIATGTLFATSATAAFGLWAKNDFGAEGRRAVVVEAHAPLREGPDPAARLTAELNEGEGVRVLSNEGDFAHVQLSRGLTGYAPRSSIGEI
jgi:tetratricopeptide (TPR) repeat protein